jgi:hypothetical protein
VLSWGAPRERSCGGGATSERNQASWGRLDARFSHIQVIWGQVYRRAMVLGKPREVGDRVGTR